MEGGRSRGRDRRQQLGAESPLAAGWAAQDVDASQAQHDLRGCLAACRWRLGLTEKLSAARRTLGAVPVGEDAEVPDAAEAIGEHAQQEAADELAGVQTHELAAAALGVVAVGDGDGVGGNGDDTLVADGDPVGVAAQVGENAFGTGNWGLAVHYPGWLSQPAEPAVEHLLLARLGPAANCSLPAR